MHPCWEAHVLKGVEQEASGEQSVCCHHLDHNSHCNTQVHYCLDELGPYRDKLEDDTDLFKDAETVEQFLPVIMSMGISSIASCGLRSHLQDKLPSVNISDDGTEITFKADRGGASQAASQNELCKVRLVPAGGEDEPRQMTIENRAMSEALDAVYVVRVDEERRLEQKSKLRASLKSWALK